MADPTPVKPTEVQKVEQDIVKRLTFFEKVIKFISTTINSGRDIAILVIGVTVLSSMGLLGKMSCNLNEKNAELNKQIMQGDFSIGKATTEIEAGKIKVADIIAEIKKDL